MRSAPKLSARSILDARDLFVRALQCLAHGREQRLDGLFALGSALRSADLLLLAEGLACELQEGLVVAAQRLAGDGVEAAAQPLQCEFERLFAFLRRCPRLTCARPRAVGEAQFERVRAAPAEQPADQQANGRTEPAPAPAAAA